MEVSFSTHVKQLTVLGHCLLLSDISIAPLLVCNNLIMRVYYVLIEIPALDKRSVSPVFNAYHFLNLKKEK
jgi:hypothetical protein